MKSCKLIISLALVIAMVLSFAIPVSATSSSVTTNFWDYIQQAAGALDSADSASQYLHATGCHTDTGCPNSPDGCHSWTGSFPTEGLVTGHFENSCAYCGMKYSDYKKPQYNNYVGTLPGNGFGRDGGGSFYIWAPHFDSSVVYQNDTGTVIGSNPFTVTVNNKYAYFLRPLNSSTIYFPVSATYYGCFSGPSFSQCNVKGCVGGHSHTDIFGVSFHADSTNYLVNSITYSNISTNFDATSFPYSFSCYLYFKVFPDDTSVTNVYVDNSRVNTTVNNYAYNTNEGDNYTYISNTPIFDETTLIFTNPITGVSVNIDDWWYDYCTRTYNLSYIDNDVTIQPTVQFGDSDITVTVGNDTYTYYYTVPDTSCDHTYVVSNTLDPTCTATGSKTYTCSNCQDTYTEVIPALGHDWVQGATVSTTYNDDETVNQQGYTLYTCSRCGLEYYDYDGTGPPANDSEVVEDLNWLQRIYYKLCDILKAILGIDTTPEVSIDTATGTDIIVNVPGEDGEEDQEFKLTDFKDKFGFLHDIYDIIASFISDVSGDSQAAYTMASNDDVSLMSDDGSASAQSFNASSPSGNASTAPAIAIDFGSANSHYGYNYGGNMSILDLSWYTQYKPTVDSILSGFLWIFFIWGCFKHAPSIISGGDMTDNHIEDIKKGSK